MNIAAYVAWAAVGSELWFDDIKGTGLIPVNRLVATVLTLHVAYLACFVVCTVVDKNTLRQKILALLLLVIALLICMLSTGKLVRAMNRHGHDLITSPSMQKSHAGCKKVLANAICACIMSFRTT